MSLATTGHAFLPALAAALLASAADLEIRFGGPFLVGLGGCAHDDAVSETAVFSNVEIFGGQGTINVPSWSPDSRHLAFVSYRRAR